MSDFKKLAKIASGIGGLHQKIVDDCPSLQVDYVTCRKCGIKEKIDPAYCLGHGWPKCCGATMTIDKVD